MAIDYMADTYDEASVDAAATQIGSVFAQIYHPQPLHESVVCPQADVALRCLAPARAV